MNCWFELLREYAQVSGTSVVFSSLGKTFAYLTPVAADVEVSLGEKQADLSVTINAYPYPNITWFKDDTPIDPNDRHFEMK